MKEASKTCSWTVHLGYSFSLNNPLPFTGNSPLRANGSANTIGTAADEPLPIFPLLAALLGRVLDVTA